MNNKLIEFLDKIASGNIIGAYPLLDFETENPTEREIANQLKIICTSHLMRMRQTKKNSLKRIRDQGFNPQTVIDVGAQIGTPELYECYPDSKHILIEPVSECLPFLKKIKDRIKNCSIINCAVSDEKSIEKISVSQTRQYSSIEIECGIDSDERIIETLTLDNIIEDFRISGDVLLKIDVDGAELKVLQGAKSLMKENCVIVIEATIGDRSPRIAKITEVMGQANYRIYDIVDVLYRPKDWHLWQVDLIFAKQNSDLWGSYSFN